MRRHHLLLAVAAVSVIASPALADDAADVRSAETAWNAAIQTKDIAQIERSMDKDFMLTGGPAGTMAVPRAAWLANLHRMTLKYYEVEVTGIELSGDHAVATVKGKWTVEFNGEEINEPFLLRDIWAWRPTGWQVIRRFVVDEPAAAPAATAQRP